MSTEHLKLGKRPAAPRPKDIKWAAFAPDITLPSVPARFGHANLFQDWAMLANGPDDSVRPGFKGAGCCVWSGAAHEHRMINKVVHRRDVPFSGATTIADYSACTGYVLGNDATDQGTDMHDSGSYRQHTGILDETGKRHTIKAYVWLDPKNWEHLMQATYIFTCAGIGFEFPNVAWEQFDAGEPWDVVRNDGGNDGGHYVPVMGERKHTEAGVVTWARRQSMTQAFYEKYNDETMVYITEEELSGKTPHGLHGFDVEKLDAFLSALSK